MKKWFGLLSILVICLTISNISFAATTLKDVKGTKYEEAVENLVEIGLVNGYPEDNTYRPNVTVTRAQMAKMMVVALGEEDKVASASKKENSFTDIKSEHWAYGYINVAKDLGVINGYPDGSFGPEDIVTYAEASTMAIRALGYDAEVAKSSEVWPNNYISYGKKLSLYDSVGTFGSGNGAARGDVALILWNMLRTGVCTVKSQSGNNLIYGPGTKMINKYKNYIYEDEAVITSVKFDDDYSEAKVTLTGDEKITLTMSDDDVLKYYGRKLKLLYNSKSKKMISIEANDDYKVVNGSITSTPTSTKIYVDDESYKLPDKDYILLYKIDKLADATEATLIKSGSTVKYVIASGAKDVYVGVVTDDDVKVDKDEAIKVKKLGSSTNKTYVLIDDDDIPSEGSIILYYLNSDDEIGILKELDVDDAKSISSLTSTKIKVGGTTYTYDSSSFVVATATTSKVSSMTFKNIDKDKDLVYVYEYAGKTYLIVFEDSVENNDDKEDALDELKKYIDSYAYLENKEASYSQSTFAEFLDALTTARSMTTSSKLVKIKDATEALKMAKANLKTVSSTSTEGKIASYRAKIRALISEGETIVKNKAQYEETSYNNFYSEFIAAKNLLKETDNTEKEAKSMYEDLSEAMSSSNLKKIANTEEHKAALERLNTALSLYGNAGAESNYTSSSYKNYKSAKEAAEYAKANSASKKPEELDNAAKELEKAFNDLQLAIDVLKNELNELIIECLEYKDNADDYMPEAFEKFESAFDAALSARDSSVLNDVKKAKESLEKAKKDLELNLITDVLAATEKAVDSMKKANHVLTDPKTLIALNMTCINSEDRLKKIANIKSAVAIDLESLISIAKSEIANASDDDLVKLAKAIAEAQTALEDATLEDMVEAYINLNTLLLNKK